LSILLRLWKLPEPSSGPFASTTNGFTQMDIRRHKNQKIFRATTNRWSATLVPVAI